ncbi:cell wall hydrolase [Litorimonas taeanensis]|uniref:Cell wall hydrolase n=1 Tax=Litorimonas taeanensis TaxID=568099 RepID=A0A420WLU8_9PROT|nr:cell wall hydrolase [Litorimonas taeanensis]RKQ72021.1 cell wall hydrolase [Litorimonas taeanensis]
MRKRRYIFAGWGIGLTAVCAASVAFPAIAEKAADQREAMQWSNLAADYLESDITLTQNSVLKSHILEDVELVQPLLTVRSDLSDLAKRDMAEHRCLSEAVYFEARSETRSGQLGVAEVIKNRVKSKHYPNSICEVVYQGSERRTGCQFSFTCDGSMDVLPKGPAWERSKEIATLSLTGFAPKLTDNATHYHTTNINPVWAPSLRYDGQIGSHKFYRFKWKERPVKPSVTMNVAPPT